MLSGRTQRVLAGFPDLGHSTTCPNQLAASWPPHEVFQLLGDAVEAGGALHPVLRRHLVEHRGSEPQGAGGAHGTELGGTSCGASLNHH